MNVQKLIYTIVSPGTMVHSAPRPVRREQKQRSIWVEPRQCLTSAAAALVLAIVISAAPGQAQQHYHSQLRSANQQQQKGRGQPSRQQQLLIGQAWQGRQLPPCNLDSFVYQAGAKADAIYGDEGSITIPPYFGFTPENRIDAGIQGINDYGLTTGHGSVMPAATGADESLGQEWVNTRAHGAARILNNTDPGMNLSSEIASTERDEERIEANSKLTQATKDLLIEQDDARLNALMKQAEKESSHF